MDFVKMEGLGNDFVVVEGPRRPTETEVTAWCDRRTGIGADGVLVVDRVGGRVQMRYWNADGGAAEMCGNGLRCVARYAFDRSWVGSADFEVDTAAGPRPVRILGEGMVRALLGVPGRSSAATRVGEWTVHPVEIGNPHAVLIVDDPGAAPVAEIGPIIEHDPAFPERTNVEFLAIRERTVLDLRVWERGVGETLACGSGAVAAAYIAAELGHADRLSTVRLPGGELDVELNDEGGWISGPANYVFSGVYRPR